MSVKISFNYEPDEPDDTDRTGMSEEEYLQLTDALMQLGADDITMERETT